MAVKRLLITVLGVLHCIPILSLHFLHLSFHKGCINEINFIAEQLNCTVTSLFIPDISPGEWDGYSSGNALYNIGHERALSIWNKHKDYFNQFDAVITSDTAPLSRIFLQNNYTKPLIIWICNRFDYCDYGSLDCDFPDTEYYQLLHDAHGKDNVYLVPYNAFESLYALHKDVECGDVIIKPTGICDADHIQSAIPAGIIKEETFFIPPYLNDASVNVVKECGDRTISVYRGRYNGAYDLKDFKGIIHIPYAWSNVAFFENIQYGLPYFVPSAHFIKQLYKAGTVWWPTGSFFIDNYCLSEWYNDDNKDLITYFDSWDDLADKIARADFDALRSKIKEYAKNHTRMMLKRWQCIFEEIKNDTNAESLENK